MVSARALAVLVCGIQGTAFSQSTVPGEHPAVAQTRGEITARGVVRRTVGEHKFSLMQAESHVRQTRRSKHRQYPPGHHNFFPEYPREDKYAHPLDTAGQELEKVTVAKLSPSVVMDHLKKLEAFSPTRSYSNADASNKVEDYLKKEFEDMGLSTCFHSFQQGRQGVTFTNVVAHIPGTTADSITVGAHYDSRPFTGKAPGAEDNGSGVASLQAMAKAFADSGIKPKRSLYFVAFAGEEPGLIGSKSFAGTLSDGGQLPGECKSSVSFLKMGRAKHEAQAAQTADHQAIIMDEVGWASPALEKPTVNLESFDWTKDLMDHLRESSFLHNGDAIKVVHNANPFGSDHMSWLDRKMPAVLTINGDDEAYPNYHQSSDTIDNVNAELLSMTTKMNLGALIRVAGMA